MGLYRPLVLPLVISALISCSVLDSVLVPVQPSVCSLCLRLWRGEGPQLSLTSESMWTQWASLGSHCHDLKGHDLYWTAPLKNVSPNRAPWNETGPRGLRYTHQWFDGGKFLPNTFSKARPPKVFHHQIDHMKYESSYFVSSFPHPYFSKLAWKHIRKMQQSNYNH